MPNSQKGFALVLILLIILAVALVAGGGYYFLQAKSPAQKTCTMEAKVCPDGSSVGRSGPNCEFSLCPASKTTPTPVSDETVSWKTFSNNQYSIKYPSDFTFNSEADSTRILSPTRYCRVTVNGVTQQNAVNEIDISFQSRSGSNFNEIWKKTFDFDFTNKSYDGTEDISGKKAYYFYSQGENPFGRQAIMVGISPNSALEINSLTPVLVSNCDKSINEYQGMSDKILSTIKFIN
jgi:hypothetical protein